MHPFVKILLFVMVLLLTSAASSWHLGFMSIVLLVITLVKHKKFIRVLVRMRWLLMTIVLIYAWSTPGELIPISPLYLAPSYEGLLLGINQLARVLIALSALHLLLSAHGKQEMIAGLYLWLLPFKYLGLNVTRFAARLMLTLHYVEALAEQDKRQFNFSALHRAFEHAPDAPITSVRIEARSFSLLDKCLLISAPIITILLIGKVF